MLVLLKSAPDTPDGRLAAKVARDASADLVLVQNGVYYSLRDRLPDIKGTVYVLDEDVAMRGISAAHLDAKARKISYGDLVDLMTQADRTVGFF